MSQYDVELIQRIEKVIGKEMEPYEVEAEDVAALKERVGEASRAAKMELKDAELNGKGRGHKRQREEVGGKDDRDRDDDVVEAGMPRIKKRFKQRR